MSGQSTNNPSRLPKWSPNLAKQGPLKATIPMSGVLKASSNMRRIPSPMMGSPSYHRTVTSPDSAAGQRSPGSSLFKVNHSKNTTTTIRRAASLDALYLKGQWPREYFYLQLGSWQIDKATQTDEPTDASRRIHCISESEGKGDSIAIRGTIKGERDLRASPGDHMLNFSSHPRPCTLTPTLNVNPGKVPPLKAGALPKCSMRSSIEGLNQEIERIVLKSYSGSSVDSCGDFRHPTPEGHRAPLPELLRINRSRSINTQTPELRGEGSSQSSGGSNTSSPDTDTNKLLGTSPQINKFLAREPPDGCEKVRLKTFTDKPNIPVFPLGHVLQPNTFKLRPSSGSAFKILQPDLEQQEKADSTSQQ